MPTLSRPSIPWKLVPRPINEVSRRHRKAFQPLQALQAGIGNPERPDALYGPLHGAKLVWARLAQYAGEDGRAYPAVSTLLKKLG